MATVSLRVMPPHTEPAMENTMVAPTKNLTTAINYEVSLVDEFVSSEQPRRGPSPVETLPSSTAAQQSGVEIINSEGASTPMPAPTNNMKRKDSNLENSATNANAGGGRRKQQRSLFQSPDSIRRSARDRQGKRDVSLARTPVKYDMQMVPAVRKNKDFVQGFPAWWNDTNKERRRSSRLTVPLLEYSCTQSAATATHDSVPEEPSQQQQHRGPFAEDSSVLWLPQKRVDWEDAVSEMTAVCTSAALYRYTADKPFTAPLSRDYIRDRVDIDDPLRGYQIRHATGGWLQGFLLWTNFTTWTHYFKWDSLHPSCGISPTAPRADVDGVMAQTLEGLTRTGDPLVGGVVFPEIAEIALVGALGCGEYLMRMALDEMRAAQTYRFVVLQATDDSKAFYEKFGFRRVGAICRYASKLPDPPIVGYRHWTHPNESDASLQLHGGPSYMMCLELPPLEAECNACGRTNCDAKAECTFLASMQRTAIHGKPTIEALGGSAPGPKPWKPEASQQSTTTSSTATTTKRKVGRPRSHPLKPGSPPGRKKAMVQIAEGQAMPRPVAKRRFSGKTGVEPTPKRRKPSGSVEGIPRNVLLTPPPEGSSLSYAQKQYHSEWLAVPPQDIQRPRPTPKERNSKGEGTRKATKKTDMERTSFQNGEIAENTTSLSTKGDRRFHSVRGGDGRFSRIYLDELPEEPLTVKQAPLTAVAKPVPKPVPKPEPYPPSSIPKAIDRAELRKQKVKAYPRDRVHFYNRVVKPVGGTNEYFFVYYYYEEQQMLRLVPMYAKGTCAGRQSGRPRYQCVIGPTDENFRLASVDGFQVVPATMVMKTALVAQEAWNIHDEN
jgi:hypothetical protein